MSDVKVTSTGQVFFKIDSQIAALLMAAFPASFEPATFTVSPAPPASSQTPTFVARNNPHSGQPQIVCFYMGHEEYYQGSPDQTDGVFGGRTRRSPSPEVVEQYREMLKKERAQNRARLFPNEKVR